MLTLEEDMRAKAASCRRRAVRRGLPRVEPRVEPRGRAEGRAEGRGRGTGGRSRPTWKADSSAYGCRSLRGRPPCGDRCGIP